jgi:O-antigen/teichoic acid export membrane protein
MPHDKKIHYFSASSLLFAARVGGAAAMFAVQVMLARTMSADKLALFFLATSLVTVAGTVAALGYPYIMVVYLRRYHDPRHGSRGHAFISASRADALLTGTFLGLVLAIGIVAYPNASWSERICFLVALPALPAIALARTNSAIGLARSLLATAYLPTILWRPLFFLFLSLFVALVLHIADAAIYTALFSAIAIAGAIIQAVKLPAAKTAKADKRLLRHWRRAATPFIAISAAKILFIDMELLLAGTLLPRKELAIFAVCLKLAFFAGFIIDVLHDLVSPELARCHARRDTAALQRNVAMTNLVAAGSTLAMMAGALLFGHTALAFFGPDYVAGQSALIILVAVQVANAFAGPNIALLTLKGAQRQINVAYAAGAAVLLVLSVVLAPLFGILGAALAVFIAFVTLNLILATYAWRLLGIRSDAWNLVQLCFAKKPIELPDVAR